MILPKFRQYRDAFLILLIEGRTDWVPAKIKRFIYYVVTKWQNFKYWYYNAKTYEPVSSRTRKINKQKQ